MLEYPSPNGVGSIPSRKSLRFKALKPFEVSLRRLPWTPRRQNLEATPEAGSALIISLCAANATARANRVYEDMMLFAAGLHTQVTVHSVLAPAWCASQQVLTRRALCPSGNHPAPPDSAALMGEGVTVYKGTGLRSIGSIARVSVDHEI